MTDLTPEQMNAEATAFAMALLMPEEFVRQAVAEMGDVDINDERAVAKLARQFDVSPQLMALRLGELRERDACYGCATQRHACKHDGDAE